MAKQREPNQSQLDYLWVNFGEYSVSSKGESGSIPTIELVSELLQAIKDQALNTLKIINDQLVGYSITGTQLFSIDISRLNSSPSSENTITKFGKRFITQEDVDSGCQFLVNSPVYYIQLSNGTQLLAPIDKYTGSETSSVVVNIKDNSIYATAKLNNENTIVTLNDTSKGIRADIKLSEDSPIKLSKEQEGLKAQILLNNQGKVLNFALKTEDEYKNLVIKDSSTVYFIKDQNYFYFGENLIGDATVKLDQYVTIDELNERLASYGMEWNSI